MAHKARRRPKWKKSKRYINSTWKRALKKFSEQMALELRKEIDREILDHLLRHINGA